MKWFYNLKIGTKLILGFVVVALIAGGIGVMGVINIRTVDRQDTYLYQKMTIPLGELIFITDAYKGISNDVDDIILSGNADEIARLEASIQEKNTIFDTNMQSFQTTLISEEGKKLVDSAIAQKDKMNQAAAAIIALVRQGKQAEAIALMKNGDYANAVAQMESDIARMIEIKLQVAEETAAALVQIVDSIEKVYGLVTNISVASNEQAIGVEQINQGISQIANVVQATSATSQETAAASEELASQAEMLKEQVSRFKLKRGGFMGTESYENMSPEMMRMFENMKEQNRQAVKKRSGQASHVPAARTIILSDDEFGKY